jgi:hypothetical protein
MPLHMTKDPSRQLEALISMSPKPLFQEVESLFYGIQMW